MSRGIRLSWLRVTGPSMVAAQVDFRPGLNVVWGASDTGKSFIFSCIDFMLGRDAPPKSIAQLHGYTTVWLAFTEHTGAQHVLERGLQGGDFRLYAASGDDWALAEPVTLHAEHDPARTDNVSRVLLSATGFDNATILTGIEKGTTRKLSFRDVAHMTLIHEERIIAERPPVYPTGQYTKTTEEMATFAHVISGAEWSGVVTSPDLKLEKAAWRAKCELYDQLIAEVQQDSGKDPDPEELEISIVEVDRKIDSISAKIEDSSKQISTIMVSRKSAWEAAQKARSRLLVVDQLRERFGLLRHQYNSDLERLRFVSEGDFFLSQLGAPHCPFCGGVLEEHTTFQLGDEARRSSLQVAATEEARKIAANLVDLDKAQVELRREKDELDAQVGSQQDLLSIADQIIRDELEPRLSASRGELTDLVAARMKLLSQQLARQRLAQLMMGQAALGQEPKKKGSSTARPSPNPSPVSLRLFANEIAFILEEWRYMKAGVVDFDREMDMVVGGEPRRNHGKGHRAVLHSAFTIATMTHCAKQNLGHTGFVLLDSPLTSYKERDRYEVDEDIQIGFYTSVAKLPKHHQVIVFENKEPPAALAKTFHHVHFSGALGVGRPGFIPERNAELRER